MAARSDQETFYPIILAALALLVFFFGLGARDVWAPVEPRYAEIARIMFAHGEWLVPRVNGELYTDKPILFFWIVLLASHVAGSVTEWTLRFPAALSGVGLVLTTYLLGRDFFSARVGFWSAVILTTSMRVIWEARWAHVDMLFCLCFVLGVYFGARALLGVGRRHEILFSYAFFGLAVLTKGLIGVVLPGLLLVAYVCARREWRLVADLKLHWGVPIFILVAAPWFYLVNRATDGSWLHEFIFVHHVQRYTAGAGHRQPVYYYLTTLPADFLPWTICLPAAVAAWWRGRRDWCEPRSLFFLLWFAVVLGFFTVSDTKRDLYLMPLLPPLALFLGGYFDRTLDASRSADGWLRWPAGLFFALIALTGVVAPAAALWYRPDASGAVIGPSVVLALGGGASAYLFLRSKLLQAFAAVALLMAGNTIAVSLWLFPYLEEYKSPRRLATAVRKIVKPTEPIFIYLDSMHDFNFYLEREKVPVIQKQGVENLLTAAQVSYLLIKQRDLKRLGTIGGDRLVATDDKGSTTWHLAKLGAVP